MNLFCKLGMHSWDGCKCSKCEKVREGNHSPKVYKCPKCKNILEEGEAIVFEYFLNIESVKLPFQWVSRKSIAKTITEIDKPLIWGKDKIVERNINEHLQSNIIPYRCEKCGFVEFYAKEVTKLQRKL